MESNPESVKELEAVLTKAEMAKITVTTAMMSHESHSHNDDEPR